MKIKITVQPSPPYDEEGPVSLWADISTHTFGELQHARGRHDHTMVLPLREGAPDAEEKEVWFSPSLITDITIIEE